MSEFNVDKITYIHVPVHHNRFLFKELTRRTDYPNLFCYKIPHVSAILSAHRQEFSAVHSAPVSFMQVFDDRFQAKSGSWLCLEMVIKNLHETYQCRMYSRELLMMGREDGWNMWSFITEQIRII